MLVNIKLVGRCVSEVSLSPKHFEIEELLKNIAESDRDAYFGPVLDGWRHLWLVGLSSTMEVKAH